MVDATSWSKGLAVEIAGHDVINHAGAAVLRVIADRTGLTSGLSRALARPGFVPIHDRGRVLADTAVLIANGGRVLSDLAMLRDQAEVCDLLCRLRLLCLDGHLAKAEPKPCATACCTPPPASSTADANAKSAPPKPGPGHSNWPPA